MKQTKLLLATIATLWCSLTASAHDFAVGGIYYNITSETDLTVEVTYRGNSYDEYSNEYSGAVTIPAAVTYNGKTYSVASIGYSAFRDCSSLTAITIPEGVTSIGYGAFYGCSSLTSIIVEEGNTTYDSRDNCNAIIETSSNCLIVGCSTTIIPEGVTSIGEWAFSDCTSLTAINIPEGVTSIERYAFYGCSSLTAITIPESVTWIGGGAFKGCSSLTAINIPEGVTSIGSNAFYGCSSLTAINIPEGVTSIGDWAFYDCSSLTSITIPESSQLTIIGNEAFRGCSSLTSITIPESVTSIGYYAFSGTTWYANQSDGVVYIGKVLYKYKGTMPENTSIEVKEGTISISPCAFEYCRSLTTITIPEGVTSIGKYAFYDCSSLTSITIPESVTRIDYEAFYGCTSLTSVHIKDIASWCNIDYGYKANPLYYAKNLYLNGELVTELTIPNTATAIKDYAFFCCSSLTSITIPENVTRIDYEAFYGCTSLKELVIEDGNETLSLGYNEYYSNKIESLFYDCPLETIYLGRNLSYSSGKSYGYSPFYNQKALTSVTIGESVTEIGDYAFCDCSSLTSITIPEGVTSIGYYAFRDCSSLTSITIPEGVTSIGDYAFRGCSSLTSITIPENSKLRSIGESTFRGCSSLPSIAIPESVTSIGGSAFEDCSSLTSITIPESVTSIGNFAFYDCTSLKELVIADGNGTLSLGYNDYYYNGTGEGLFYDCPLETIFLGRNLSYSSGKSYGYSPFYNKKALTSVTIGESVTSIEDYAFWDCSNLTSITIPENSQLTSIGESAFRDCSSLPSIAIPESVTSIGESAFYYCDRLTAVHIKDIASWCNIDFDGYIANPLYYAKNLYLNGELVTELTIPNTVTAIKSYAFFGCSSLTSITIPESVTSIGKWAFYNCSSLTSITIPENSQLTSIGWGAFSYCSRLTSITLSEGVTSIGDDSFSGCSNVENLVVKGSAMPYVPSDKLKKIVLYSPAPLQSKGFSSTVYQNCMLYVPQQGLARYQIVEPWAYFWNIIAFDTSDIAPAELPEDDSAPIIYDLRGQRVDVPTRGNIYIVNGRKVLY